MKIIFLSLILLNFTTFVSSQNNLDDFLNPTNEWYIDYGRITSQMVKYKFSNNPEVIGDKEYYPLMSNSSDDENWLQIEPNGYSGLFRQDNKKVFMYNFEGPEYLVYDFNMALGDTIITLSSMSNNIVLKVLEIDSIVLENSVFRKRTLLGCSGEGLIPEQWPNYWIDGIGSEWGFEFGEECSFDGGGLLVCFKQSLELLYKNTQYETCWDRVSNNNTLNDIIFSIKPNPASDRLFIHSESKIEKVELYQMTGKLVFSGTLNIIDVSSFQKGIYFIKISFPYNQEKLTKWIKN